MNEFRTDDRQASMQTGAGLDTGDVVEKAKTAGRQVQAAAADIAGSSTDALRDHASHAMDAAKDLASSAQDRIQDKITEQKSIGADYASNFADTMRRAADQFDGNMPVAGDYMRKAADQIEYAADAVRDGNMNDLVQGAQKFARSQPTAFFGLALLAGFGVVRFLKSASAPASSPNEMRSPSEDDLRPSYEANRRAM